MYKGSKRRTYRDKVVMLQQRGTGPGEITRMIGCSRMQVYRIVQQS